MARWPEGSNVHGRIDRVLDLLGNAHRRYVVYALRSDAPATVDELADAVVTGGVADDRERVASSLVHVHLPKLDDCGVVTYRGPGEPVALADGVDRLAPFLDVAARRETDRIAAGTPGLAPESVAGPGSE